jgi:uncharacterized protein
MKKFTAFSIGYFILVTSAFSQVDTLQSKGSTIFDRLTKELKEYRPDTTAVPNDKITMAIIELRNLRGGFNINEAIEYKLEEDKQKKEMPEAEFEKFSVFLRTGNGKKWLDNSVIWIYRQHFTYRELKRLVKFYKTSAGQKMATEFPIVMMKSLAASESIKKIYEEGQTIKK